VLPPCDELVFDQEVAECGDDRSLPTARTTLWRADLARPAHAALDADHSGGEVDVLPHEGAQFAAAKACGERRAPECTVLGPESIDECRGFVRRGDSLAASADRRKPETLAGAECEVAVFDRQAVDHPQRLERVTDRARVGAAGEHAVDERLDVAALDPREANAAENGEDVQPQRSLVLANHGRLVLVACPCSDCTRSDPG
jgi:hypothetical protein